MRSQNSLRSISISKETAQKDAFTRRMSRKCRMSRLITKCIFLHSCSQQWRIYVVDVITMYLVFYAFLPALIFCLSIVYFVDLCTFSMNKFLVFGDNRILSVLSLIEENSAFDFNKNLKLYGSSCVVPFVYYLFLF